MSSHLREAKQIMADPEGGGSEARDRAKVHALIAIAEMLDKLEDTLRTGVSGWPR